LGLGDPGLGIGHRPPPPTPNPHSPIHNPQSPKYNKIYQNKYSKNKKLY